jgi:hypothetical protein
MRYAAISTIVLGLAFSLPSSGAWGAGVSIEVGVNAGAGAELDIGYFHSQLAAHGQWVDTAAYGRAWQPALVVTDTNWRPYVDGGHWTYTDAGWYWDSSYEWGWAAFHYGRWNRDAQYGWLWTPDTTWAPAWVSWRQSDSVYGWAPLPYGSRLEGGLIIGGGLEIRAEAFTFVPSQSFLSVNLGTVAYERGRVGTVYNQTTVINNSYTYNDNRVINNGIPLKQVATATKQEIKPTQIADAKAPTAGGAAGGKISAYRPAIKNETPKASPTDKKGADAKATTPQSKAGADTSIPASYIQPEPGADSKKNAAAPKPADPKAMETNRAKTEAKPADSKATEPTNAKPEAKPTDPKATEPSNAKAEAKPAEPKAMEPGPAKPGAKLTNPKALEADRVKSEAKQAEWKGTEPTNAKPEAKPTEPKATEPSNAKAEAKLTEPKATEPSNAKAEAKLTEPKATEPSNAKAEAKPAEPKAAEPSNAKEGAKKEEAKSGRE